MALERETHLNARSVLNPELEPRAGARVELQLQGQLHVVCQRTALVIIEGVIEHGEDALRRDRVGGVGEHGAEHVREGRHLALPRWRARN